MPINVSVIVCTYNRAQSLRQTLQSLVDQKLSGGLSYEIIVVDNNSSDRTREVMDEFMARNGRSFTYRFEGRQGLSVARNTGIRAAHGQILAFTDDDVTVHPEWVESLWNCFRETGARMVGGKIERLWLCDRPNWFRDEIDGPLIVQDLGQKRKKWDSSRHTVGANMAFHRSVFEQIGFFRDDLGRRGELLFGGEDREIFLRTRAAGLPIYYEPKAVVWHKVETGRLTKEYLRKWFSEIGQTLGHEMDWKWHYRFSVAPLWIWKKMIRSFGRWIVAQLRGADAESERFTSEIWLRHHTAIFQERFNHWLPTNSGKCIFKNHVIARSPEGATKQSGEPRLLPSGPFGP